MRASVFQKAVSLLLCAVLTVGFFPGVDAHAEEADGALSAEQRQAVVSRQMDGWVFPLPEEFFDDITDFSGCRGQNPSALYDGTNPGCTHAGHADAPAGSTGLYVSVTGQQPVYAPAGGTVYFGNDAQWGSVAVVEVPVSGDYSYYILLGSVSPALGSGSYVDAGTTLGTTGGEFRMAALMDYAGMGEQIAAGVSSELTAVESFGWLVGSTGTGLICVNPSGNTQSQYPSSLASSFPGPITYSFAAAQPPVTEHTHVFDQQVASDAYLAAPATADSPAMYYYSCLCGEKGTETFPYGEKAGHTFSPDWSYDENNHWHADTCGHPDITDSFGPHQWNAGEITVQPTHTAAGTMVYTCTVCGAQKSETVNPTTEHVFDQMNTDAKYLKSEATCTAPAEYYYSCICGEKGTETFAYGQAKGHSFSDKWSFDAENHWHPATCEHTGEQGSFGPHRWNYGEITKNAGHAVDGEKLYTCLDCGYQKTEVIPGQAHEFNQMVAQDKYLAAAATCTTPAQYYYSCTCGLAGTDTFPYGNAKGHTFADKWSYNELQHWKAATCEHTDEKIQVADHIWNPGVITTQPTATTKGVKTYTCSVCGATKTEEVEPSTHQHTFSTAWQGNATYHWHPATCEHTNVVSGLGEHQWNAGVVNVWPTHTTTGMKTYTCTVCSLTKTETLEQTHTFDQMNPSSAFLKSQATCTSPAVYYKSCSCGAKGTETFTYGNALGHTASGTWGKDANYHWTVCSRCGAKGDLVAHSFDSSGKCTVCGYSKEEAHVHTSHLTKVPAKAATCTTEGNTGYYTCECGAWFTDVTCKTPINDHQSVVIPATGHVDSNGDGRCDVCRQRMDNTVEYQVTEGGEATWLNTSNQGMVFRSNAEYAKFDRIEVDGATVTAGNYSVSEGSTVVELSASYLKRLSLGRHTLSIVSKDGKASTGFTIKQGATAAKSGGPWGMILLLTVVVAIAIPVTFGVMYYRKKTGYND